MKKEKIPELVVRIVVLKSGYDELEFEAIDHVGHVKRFYLDRYGIAQFRGEKERDIIEHLVLDYVQDIVSDNFKLRLLFL